jgi:hypothetical protein
MIELSGNEWDCVPIPYHGKKIIIEAVSSKKIDFGIVDDPNLKKFENDDEFEAFEWHEDEKGPRILEFFVPTDKKKYWLVFWNTNERSTTYITYNFSEWR